MHILSKTSRALFLGMVWVTSVSLSLADTITLDPAFTTARVEKPAQTIKLLDAKIAANPSNEFALARRYLLYNSLKNREKATADLERLIDLSLKIYTASKNRDQVEAGELAYRYDRLALDCQNHGEYLRAVDLWTRAIALTPKTYLYYKRRGQTYSALCKPDLAAKDMDTLKKMSSPSSAVPADWQYTQPDSKIYLIAMVKAFEAFRTNDFDEALTQANFAIKRRPQSEDARRVRAYTSCMLGLYDQAIADCNVLLTISPTDKEAISCKKDAQVLAKKFGPTTQEFYPEAKQWWRQLYENVENGKQDEALRLALIHVKEHPKNVFAHDILAKAHETKKQRKEAVEDMTHAIALDPTKREDIVGRANLYHDLQLYQKSADDYARVIELGKLTRFRRPTTLNTDELYYRHASNLQSLGKLDAAISDYNEILRVDPQQEEAYRYRGDCYFQQGKNELAIADYTKSIEHDSMSAGSTYLARAKVYDKLGKFELAKTDKKKASELGFKGDKKDLSAK
jgi:tetratricopeptide (TPR) repeat protein